MILEKKWTLSFFVLFHLRLEIGRKTGLGYLNCANCWFLRDNSV